MTPVTSKRRLLGLDRSGPKPTVTMRGQPLRPLTIPNLVGYARLAGIPVFLYLALSSDDGRAAGAAVVYLAIAASDYLDGFLARATGQYSRLGALLDPFVDRLTVLAGVVVCWKFELLPRWALAILAAREIVTLVVPGFNDSDEELTGIAEFLAGVDRDIPWHITAYHEDYKMNNPSTSASHLLRAYEIGKRAGLRYIYPGNIPGAFGDKEGTHCPSCDTLVIGRRGFRVTSYSLVDGKCPNCATVIPGVWDGEAAVGRSGVPKPVWLA